QLGQHALVGALALGGGELVLGLDHLGARGPAQGDAARQRRLQRASHAQHAGRARGGVARAPQPRGHGVAQLVAHHVGQGEVIEEDLHELGARQREGELIHRVTPALPARAPAAPAAPGPVDLIAPRELLVARMHDLAVATRPVPEGRLGNVPRGQVDVTGLVHVLDRAFVDHAAYRLADLVLVTPDEAGPVDGALVAPVQATIDKRIHVLLLSRNHAAAGRLPARAPGPPAA